ncbi:hypothetical protein P7K49_013155 [Saguinus oedipus]|uniref:Uncharacterized protein n=1 Tax=Saguinus oedipus TaxID=9490 RepID=A0ABQ9VF28_SAGOE|nr:hypothetical protein P7K49_013155 [Saguinus oedipus]
MANHTTGGNAWRARYGANSVRLLRLPRVPTAGSAHASKQEPTRAAFSSPHGRTARVAAPRSRDSQADTREVKNTGPSQRLNREQDRLARSTVDRTPPHASRPDLQRRFARGQRIPDNPVVQNHNSQ